MCVWSSAQKVGEFLEALIINWATFEYVYTFWREYKKT
jgi:hypothetical protein